MQTIIQQYMYLARLHSYKAKGGGGVKPLFEHRPSGASYHDHLDFSYLRTPPPPPFL